MSLARVACVTEKSIHSINVVTIFLSNVNKSIELGCDKNMSHLLLLYDTFSHIKHNVQDIQPHFSFFDVQFSCGGRHDVFRWSSHLCLCTYFYLFISCLYYSEMFREFIQMWNKCPFGTKEELIRFGGQRSRSLWSTEQLFRNDPQIKTLIMTK